jgi:F-type H+-transporting ATPase subunit epsilon
MLHLEIVTPEQKAYSDDVDSVVIPCVEGEIGVLPQHEALMTQLIPGELRVIKGGEELRLAVGEGFVEVSADKVAVLTDMAMKESEIDETAAEEAVKRAEEAMKAHKMDDEEYATVKASLQKSLAMVRVKRRKG